MIEAIVVGTDGSPTAAVAVREAVDLAKSLGARLHVVSAYQPLSGVRVAGEEAIPSSPPRPRPDRAGRRLLEQAAGAAHARASRRTAMRAGVTRPRRSSTWPRSSAPT